MTRTVIMVERPAGFSGGFNASYRHGETWKVTVTEERHPGRKDFVVEATMLHENRPSGKVTIPGVRLGPKVYTTLSAARKRARECADVLSGQLFPKWEETHFKPQSA